MKLRVVVSTLFLLAIAAACGPVASQGPSPTGSPSSSLSTEQAAFAPAGPTLGGQRAGDVLAWLASTPELPRQGDARIDAYVVGLDGRPMDDVSVVFDTDMTNMSHGKYLVVTEPAGNGHYAGQVHFLMPGPWRIIAAIERPGRDPLKLRFEFTVGTP